MFIRKQVRFNPSFDVTSVNQYGSFSVIWDTTDFMQLQRVWLTELYFSINAIDVTILPNGIIKINDTSNSGVNIKLNNRVVLRNVKDTGIPLFGQLSGSGDFNQSSDTVVSFIDSQNINSILYPIELRNDTSVEFIIELHFTGLNARTIEFNGIFTLVFFGM